MKITKRRTFDCAATFANGVRYTVTEHIVDDTGRAQVGLEDFHLQPVSPSVAATLIPGPGRLYGYRVPAGFREERAQTAGPYATLLVEAAPADPGTQILLEQGENPNLHIGSQGALRAQLGKVVSDFRGTYGAYARAAGRPAVLSVSGRPAVRWSLRKVSRNEGLYDGAALLVFSSHQPTVVTVFCWWRPADRQQVERACSAALRALRVT